MKYWYLRTHEWCPVCGRGRFYRERQYTEKPEDFNKRHVEVQRYDYCEEGYI